MSPSPLAIKFAIFLLAWLTLVCLSGIFLQEIRGMIGTFFALLLRPLLLINSSLETFWHGVREFYRVQFSANGRMDLKVVFSQFIGATLYSIFFCAFIFSEFQLLALSLTAAGINAGYAEPPMSAGSLTAIAMIASFLFWGAMILDLSNMTNTAPWRESLNEKWRKALLYVALFCIALSVFVTASMGLFRGKVIADDSLIPFGHSQNLSSAGGLTGLNSDIASNEAIPMPQTSPMNTKGVYYWIPIIANVSIPIIVGIAGVFASWGIVALIKFITLFAGFLAISPLGLLLISSSLLMNIIDRIYQFLDSMLQLLSAMGQRFMGLFGWKPSKSSNTVNPDDGDDPVWDPDSSRLGGFSDEGPSTIHPSHEGWNPYQN